MVKVVVTAVSVTLFVTSAAWPAHSTDYDRYDRYNRFAVPTGLRPQPQDGLDASRAHDRFAGEDDDGDDGTNTNNDGGDDDDDSEGDDDSDDDTADAARADARPRSSSASSTA